MESKQKSKITGAKQHSKALYQEVNKMVRKSKAQRHQEEIIGFLQELPGATVDQWGHIKIPFVGRKATEEDPTELTAVIRYKVKKTALRKEVKADGSKNWNKLWSAYFKDLKLEVTDEKTKLIILKTM